MRSRVHTDRLVIATTNRGKLEELRGLLSGLPLVAHSVEEVLPEGCAIVEDGRTFGENAEKKAQAVARATLMIALADDSGLQVDLLGGLPGVRSARFAHDRASDAENNAALLAAIDRARGASGAGIDTGAEPGELRARFRCALALVDPFTGGGRTRMAEGVCEGSLTRAPRGSGGFGYDPLFVVDGTDKTLAELDADAKSRVSHRAAAFAALRPALEELLDERARQIARLG